MNHDNDFAQHRIGLYREEMAAMRDEFSEAITESQTRLLGHLPLQLLTLVRQLNYDCADLDQITSVAMEVLPNSTDSDPALATLKGARALHSKLAGNLSLLTALVMMQLPQPAEASSAPGVAPTATH